MERYKNLWIWMIVPMIIMQLGIYMDYWGDFSDNPWSVHIHYWTGTLWYAYLIMQPYFVTHGQNGKTQNKWNYWDVLGWRRSGYSLKYDVW